MFDDFDLEFGFQEDEGAKEAEVNEETPAQAPYQPDFEDIANEEAQEKEAAGYGPVSPKQKGKANIVVLGIGGGGCNAVNNMVKKNVTSATFVVMNTDVQALNMSPVADNCKIQIGENTTQGLGAGSDPEVGRLAAEESRERIKAALEGVDLLFITAGMGGGTGTGAAPIVAEIAQGMHILTVGVVTKPFTFEGSPRIRNAEDGIKKLREYVDTLLVIPNQKLTTVFGDSKKMPLTRAFAYADDVLRQCIQGVSDVIVKPGLINLDFADVRTILSKKGLAHMGIGYGKGEKRVMEAVRNAIYCPLLENDIQGATALLINIIGGEDMTIDEVESACTIVNQVTDPEANIIFGTATRPETQNIEITIIATGFSDQKPTPQKAFVNNPYGQGDVRPMNGGATMQVAPQKSDMFAPKQDVYPPKPEMYPQRPQYGDGYRYDAPRPQGPAPSQPQSVPNSMVDIPQRKVPLFIRKLKDSSDNPQQ